ncbi:hypothetical protein [Streptomyces sp. NPDC058874]|uniref:hypothetical protein n=1 Tax=unclassified Streptomyces TaxID=2593676 RepID=UPI0036B448EE
MAMVKRERGLPWEDWEEGESQLGVAETTLSRWLKSETVPSRTKLRELIRCLDLCIHERNATDRAREIAPISVEESEEGMRLRGAAEAARDQAPAQRAYAQAQQALDEAGEQCRLLLVHLENLLGRRDENRRATAATLMELTSQAGELALALGEEVIRANDRVLRAKQNADRIARAAMRREEELNARIEEVEKVLENWQDRYDRAHAARETAREDALSERLEMEDALDRARDLLAGSQDSEDRALRRAEEQEKLRGWAERDRAETAARAQLQYDLDPRWH